MQFICLDICFLRLNIHVYSVIDLGTKPVSRVDYLKMFRGWVGLLDSWDQHVEKIKDIDDLRGKHNKVYSELVAQISDTTENNEFAAAYMTQVQSLAGVSLNLLRTCKCLSFSLNQLNSAIYLLF